MERATTTDRYFYSLDAIRGIAAFLVVIRHTGSFFGELDFPVSYLAVDVFFLLSGIVIAGSYEKRLRSGLTSNMFMRIRLARIYPLYIFGSLITVLSIAGNFSHEFTVRQALSALPLACLLLPSTLNGFPLNGPAWSVFFELLVNFAYGIFSNFLTDRVLKIIVLISGLILITLVVMHPKHHLDVGLSFPYYAGIFRTTYSFFLGILLYRIFSVSQRPKAPQLAKNIVPWLFVGAITLLLTAKPDMASRPYFVIFSVLFVFPALIYSSLRFQPSGFAARICQMLGTASYGVYAVHVPLAAFADGILTGTFGIGVGRYAPWSGLLFLLILFLLCLLLDRFYDRPFRHFMLRKALVPRAVEVSA